MLFPGVRALQPNACPEVWVWFARAVRSMVLKRTLTIAKEPELDDEEVELEKFKVIGPTAAD